MSGPRPSVPDDSPVRRRQSAMPQDPPLILASTSRYRRELLERLRIPFQALSPGTDETPLPGEAPAALAERLALAKPRAFPTRW